MVGEEKSGLGGKEEGVYEFPADFIAGELAVADFM